MPSSVEKSHRVVFCLIVVSAISFACAAKQSAGADPATATPPAEAAPSPAPSPPATAKATATPEKPGKEEVEQAIQRVYKDTVVIQLDKGGPYFTGDFNADGSPDLAVIVKPTKGGLAKLNSEYANWILEDPRKVRAGQKTKPAPEKVAADELLLVVLHGYQETGWRHKYARQSFLLRNSVGENLQTQALRDASQGKRVRDAPGPQSGDVIREKLAGREGFLYWNNARYAWMQ